jgi:hypothetical protein
MVRGTGFEPAQPFGHKRLRLTRLPVPPSPHWPDAAILPPNSMRKHRTQLKNDSTRFLHPMSSCAFLCAISTRRLHAFSLCVVSTCFLCASSQGVVSAHLLHASSAWVCAGTGRLPSRQACDILGYSRSCGLKEFQSGVRQYGDSWQEAHHGSRV